MTFELRFPKDEIRYWLNQYPANGDKEMLEIGAQAREVGYYTQEQFRRVCDWKTRRRPHRHYDENSPERVAVQTYKALTGEDEAQRITALTELKGVSFPTASMLLQLAFPESYPVIDFRALWSLGYEEKRVDLKLWLAYLPFCRTLAKECGLSLRDLDRSMWEYSRTNQPKDNQAITDAELDQ